MEAWLTGAIEQGGTLALAVMAIYFLNRLWRDRLEAERAYREQRLEAEKSYREALEKQYARDKEEISAMWKQTWEALENNTRVFTIFMERFDNLPIVLPQPASKPVPTRPRKDT